MILVKGDNAMNAQFKKGVLELIVLESVRQKDMYGYEQIGRASCRERVSSPV